MATTKPETLDLAAVKDLLLWARKERMAISQLSVGGVALAVTDLALSDSAPKVRGLGPDTKPQDPYERYAGDALEALRQYEGDNGAAEEMATYEDDD